MSVELIKNFNIDTFNKQFDKEQDALKKLQQENDNKELDKLQENVREKTISEMTIQEYMSDWKYSLLNLVNNLLHFNININTLTQQNTIFHTGMTIFLFIIFFYIMYSLYHITFNNNNNNRIIHEYYVKF